MQVIRRNWKVYALFLLICVGCFRQRPILNEQQLINLLVDMHATDGTLAVSGSFGVEKERKNYLYFNGVFEKYGIDKNLFDSCMLYYSNRPAQLNKIYEAVIDTLNSRLTVETRTLAEYKQNDSINYFPVVDTIHIDTTEIKRTYHIDSLNPGNYNFSMYLKFDTLNREMRDYRILSRFITPDSLDTLYARDIKIIIDTAQRRYQWTQFIDSSYTRLEILMFEAEKEPKIPAFGTARIWDVTLFKPYLSEKKKRELRNGLPQKKSEKEPKVQEPVEPVFEMEELPLEILSRPLDTLRH